MKLIFFARRYTTNFSTSRCYQFWWARLVMPKVLKITSLQNVRNISRKNWEMKLIFCMLINNVFILQGDTIFFDGFGQTCPMYPGKFAISLNISRKKLGVLCFNGGVCFSDGGCFIFKWRGGAPNGGHWFWGGRGFEKNRKMGCPPQLWETLLVVSLFYFALLFLLVYITSCWGCYVRFWKKISKGKWNYFSKFVKENM